MPSRPACREWKKNGRPCRAPALREGSACFWHAAETREAAAEARRLGGLRRRREGTVGGAYALEGFRTGADLQRVLELALADTLELENTVPRTRALTQLVSVAARVQETTAWEARLRALEDGVWRGRPAQMPDLLPQAPHLGRGRGACGGGMFTKGSRHFALGQRPAVQRCPPAFPHRPNR